MSMKIVKLALLRNFNIIHIFMATQLYYAISINAWAYAAIVTVGGFVLIECIDRVVEHYSTDT